MSSGNFVLNNDLFFKPSRRVLSGGRWDQVPPDELRELPQTDGPPVSHPLTPTPSTTCF